MLARLRKWARSFVVSLAKLEVWRHLTASALAGPLKVLVNPSGIVHVFSEAGGLGDELMAVSAIQAAARTHANLQLVFHSRFEALFQGLSEVAQVRPFVRESLPAGALGLSYLAKQPIPVNAQMGGQLGVQASEYPITLPDSPLQLPDGWPHSSHRIILVQTRSSDWTPNKQWSQHNWSELIEKLPADAMVVEVGMESILEHSPRRSGWLSLVGQTSLAGYVSCFRQASLFIGPVSSGMHLSHAFSLPAVIIVGGYEAAHFPYPEAVQLGSTLSCSPCWLRTPCPYDRRCLREITPEQVLDAVRQQLSPASPP